MSTELEQRSITKRTLPRPMPAFRFHYGCLTGDTFEADETGLSEMPEMRDGEWLDGLLEQVVRLEDEELEDEYGRLRPTEHAVSTSMQWLIGAARVMMIRASRQDRPVALPDGFAATDSEGGIRIEWRGSQGQMLILVVPAEKGGRGFIYRKANGESNIDHDVSGESLASKLVLLE